jgi:hypothetical protein
MSATWLINDQTPKALGIEAFTRRSVNTGRVSLTISLKRDIDASALFTYKQAITVKKNGVNWFVGKVREPGDSGDTHYEGSVVFCENNWWELERTLYLLTYPPSESPTAANTGGRRTLFIGPDTNEPETTQQALERVLTYAAAKGLLTIGTGLTKLGSVTPPRESLVDRSIADAIHAIMRYHVDLALYWDGNTINITERGDDILSYAVGTKPLASCSARIRHDLVPEGVIIRYEKAGDVQAVVGWRGSLTQDKWPGSVEIDDTDILVETITLKEDEPTPSGIAKRYYDMLATSPLVEGELEFLDEDCGTGIRPGHTINITGGRAAWSTMKAFVQSVTESPMLGVTSVEVGIPGRLSAQDLLDLLRNQHRIRSRDLEASDNTDVADNLPASQGPLCGYCEMVGTNVVFRISSGVISTGESETTENVPKWEFTSTLLSAAIPPGTVVTEGMAFDYYLYAEVDPVPETFAMLDADGNAVVEQQGVGPCDAVDLRMVFSPTAMGAPRKPELDPETGDVIQTGRYYLRFGGFVWPVGGTPTVNPERLGSYYLLHVPPSRLVLVPS